MAFFKKLKERLFKSSSKLEAGLNAIVGDSGDFDKPAKSGNSTFYDSEASSLNPELIGTLDVPDPNIPNTDGDAIISDKHANFFVNKKNAKSMDMKSLINFVKKRVRDKTGVKLELEIVLVE